MVLCRSPVVANDYWNDIVSVNQMGLQVDPKTVAALARKHACEIAFSANLKPTKYVAGMFEMTDGTRTGWASPQSCIFYVNRRQFKLSQNQVVSQIEF